MITQIKEQTSMALPLTDNTVIANLERPLLALTISHNRWLELLADEWLFFQDAPAWPHLGIGRPCLISATDRDIAVTLWIDSAVLPQIEVASYKDNKWLDVSLRNLGDTDKEIIWPGPIPLFAVAYFSVNDPSARARLIAMAKSFSNVESPYQPIKIIELTPFLPADSASTFTTVLKVPPSWNAIRASAAMAVWALPAADPWHDALCESLAIEDSSNSIFKQIDIPWLLDAPWRLLADTNNFVPMWRAILNAFSNINIRNGWLPHEILETICSEVSERDVDHKKLSIFKLRTIAILNDRESINIDIASDNPLGLALQLILLRPLPERFENWKKDLPGIPPAVWWTGAILAGFLCGFRDLDHRFRGTSASRKAIDLRLWKISSKGDMTTDWPDNSNHKFKWKIVNSKVQFLSGEDIWLERSETIRGKWYRADLKNSEINSAALDIVKLSNPELIYRSIRIENEGITFSGEGKVSVGKNKKHILIKGAVSVRIPSTAKFFDELDEVGFRELIAKGSIKQPLRQPPEITSIKLAPDKDENKTTQSEGSPPGLTTILDFLSPAEETALVNIIDQAEWSNEMSRRVQHYGWRYNYRERKITPKSYIGPLPEWAHKLAQLLFIEGALTEMPDQVIVNEYIGSQGISQHVDCLSCFRGPVITISLLESWGMIFRKADQKIEKLLNNRSATIISGSARYDWSHEIPKRKNEIDGQRVRRISLTFRKVNI